MQIKAELFHTVETCIILRALQLYFLCNETQEQIH
jgi:hypothetical protein